jgi:hypothetical protein
VATALSRRSASIRAPSRPIRYDDSPIAPPPISAATTMTTEIDTIAPAPAPVRTRSTSVPRAYTGTIEAAAASTPTSSVPTVSARRPRSSARNQARVCRAVAIGRICSLI